MQEKNKSVMCKKLKLTKKDRHKTLQNAYKR